MVLLCLKSLIEVKILKSAHRLGLGDQKREKMGRKPPFLSFFILFLSYSCTKMAITRQPTGRLLRLMVLFYSPGRGLFRKRQKHGVGSIRAEKMGVENSSRTKKCTNIGILFSLYFARKEALRDDQEAKKCERWFNTSFRFMENTVKEKPFVLN